MEWKEATFQHLRDHFHNYILSPSANDLLDHQLGDGHRRSNHDSNSSTLTTLGMVPGSVVHASSQTAETSKSMEPSGTATYKTVLRALGTMRLLAGSLFLALNGLRCPSAWLYA